MSVIGRKSWKDVRRRWARSLFTIATIAVAISGLSLFALMPLLNQAMDRRVVDDRLHDIQIYGDDIALSPSEVAQLKALLGVAQLDTRTVYSTRLHIGDKRVDALLLGVSDFSAQQVDVVHLRSGAIPGPAEALSDTQNGRSGRFSGGAGTVVQVEDNAGHLHPVTVSGTGNTLEYTQIAADDRAVLYVPQTLVNQISGATGVNRLDVLVKDPQQAPTVLGEFQSWFATNRADAVFSDLPDVRKAGTWPGKDVSQNFATLFYVGGILALLSAIALVSNTMTTMVAEQRGEIAIMKAIGGRRRQVVMSFLRTVWILAGIGTVIGVLIGIPFSNLLAGFVGNQFLGVQTHWGYSWPVIIFSLVIGLVGTSVAAIPALLQAARMPVRQGLQGELSASQGSWLDRVLRRAPLPRTAQVGLRNISRRKTRTIGTVIQVGLAVGVALGFMALGVTIGNVTAQTWDTLHYDIIVSQRSNTAFDARAVSLIQGTDGVESGHAVLYNSLGIDGTQYEAWGMPVDTKLYEPDIISGRWFEAADADVPVAVVGRALAAKAGLKVGDTVKASAATGPVDLQIIGIDGHLINNATTIFVPLQAFQKLLGRSDTNAFWVVSKSQDHASIDRLAANLEDSLGAAGYPSHTQIRYVERNANLASNQVLVGVLAVMGVPIVAIGLIGLVNMMTMNVFERTREIGILRCIGARGRDITRIFQTEAISVALLGWMLAVPSGWLIGWILARVVSEMFKFGSVPYSYPAWYLPIALVATLLLAWLVVIAPVRRAVRLRPGDALRYE